MKSEYKYKGLKDDGNKPAKVKVNTYDVRYEFPVWDGASLQLGATYLEAEKNKNGSYRTYTIEKKTALVMV